MAQFTVADVPTTSVTYGYRRSAAEYAEACGHDVPSTAPAVRAATASQVRVIRIESSIIASLQFAPDHPTRPVPYKGVYPSFGRPAAP